jgi:hypothetical protein
MLQTLTFFPKSARSHSRATPRSLLKEVNKKLEEGMDTTGY